MLNGWALYRLAAACALAVAVCAGSGSAGQAQEFVYRGGAANGPTVEEYLEEIGPDASVVDHGELSIDGTAVNCGKRPTVLNPNFDSWGGAFPGFVILNSKKINGLNTQVKLYIYSHECGHQFIGADEVKADLFAIRRGVKWGWLDAQGLEDICVFISQLKGDAVHPPGPRRCKLMRNYYRELIEGGTQRASSTPPSRAQTLGPAH
jgi:hypothetical protein